MSWVCYEPQFEYQKIFNDSDWPWSGHKNFAYDLVRNTKPRVIVELGTHKGTSFFSMCQAVKDSQLNTKLYAIDTWKGDRQSGLYGEEVFVEVQKIVKSFYDDLNIFLLRKTFDEAVKEFKDQSVDILHIDGLHTYNEVNHDYNNWLPKVKNDGIIMFHDVSEKQSDFGVYKLWDKLKKGHETLEFFHSHGLGVLFKNRTSAESVKLFKSVWQKYYPLFTDKQVLTDKVAILQSQNNELMTQAKKNTDELAALQHQFKDLESENSSLKLRNNHMQSSLVKEKQKHEKAKLDANELRTQLHRLEEHASNLDTFLSEQIFPSKFFRLWQSLNKAKKLVKELVANPQKLPKVIRIVATQGPRALVEKLRSQEIQLQQTLTVNQQYQLWLKKNYPQRNELLKQKRDMKKFKLRPKISILTPIYNTPERFLRECIESVIRQTYDKWELCLVDDASKDDKVRAVIKEYAQKDKRIKFLFRKKNGHISRASNDALKLTSGEFVGLLDHDDILWPDALYEVAKIINENPETQFIYSDEDKLEEDGITHVDPFFKPDWSPDYLRSINYITHFTVLKTSLVKKIGGFRVDFEGAQDWDLFLQATRELEKGGLCHPLNQNNLIKHIPTILYSWRKSTNSTASEKNIESVKRYAYQSQEKALEDDLKQRSQRGKVLATQYLGLWRIKYKIVGNPLISIIIPTKDKYEYISKCLSSVLSKTTYKNYELVIIDTGSQDRKVWDLYQKEQSEQKKIRILRWQKDFNFSTICNFGVQNCKGKYVVLLNNDTEIITPDWIESMLEYAQQRRVGAVGCKLLYPDGSIQHAGVILGIGMEDRKGIAGHFFKSWPNNSVDFFKVTNVECVRNFSAVTAACLMISKRKYLNVGKISPALRVAFNDIDFCLKLFKAGYWNIYTPFAVLKHYESISVGKPGTAIRDMTEFRKEINLMHAKWDDLIKDDCFYNPNLSSDKEDFSLRI